MSRPKSVLTGTPPRNLSARLTEEQHIMYIKLGAVKWLREKINSELEKQNMNIRC